MVPEAAAGKNTPERRLCATEECKEELARGQLLYFHYTMEPNAVRAAWALAEPSPCCLKTVLNCPACPVRPM